MPIESAFEPISKADIQKVKSQILAEMSRRGTRRMLDHGGWPHKAPLGYTNVRRGPDRVIVVDPVTGPLVRRLFEKAVQSDASLSDLTVHAHNIGLLSATGEKLSRKAVIRILSNPFNMGIVRHGIKLRFGMHERLVTPGDWHVVADLTGKAIL